MLYYELISKGVPAQEAFKQAFPNGLPKKPQPKDVAAAQQKQAIGQVVGSVGGALGTVALMDAVRGKPILGAIRGIGSSSAAGEVASAGAGAATGGAAAGGTAGAGAANLGAGAPSMLAPEIGGSVGASGGGAAAGGAGTAGSSTIAAGGYMPYLGPAAVLATIPVGQMLAKKFFPSTPSRPFDVKEYSQANTLDRTIPGFDKASEAQKAKVAEILRGKSNSDSAQNSGSMMLYSRGNAKEQKPYEFYPGLYGRDLLQKQMNPNQEGKGWGGPTLGAQIDAKINSMSAREQLEAVRGKISKKGYEDMSSRLNQVEGVLNPTKAQPAAPQPVARPTPAPSQLVPVPRPTPGVGALGPSPIQTKPGLDSVKKFGNSLIEAIARGSKRK